MSSRGASTRFELLRLRIRKLFFSLRSRPTRRALRLGVFPAVEHVEILRLGDFDFIVDVGANRGQFLMASMYACPLATVLSFEPHSKANMVLRKVASYYPDQTYCFQVALSDESGTSTLFVAKDDDNSSILMPSSIQVEFSRGSEVASEELGLLLFEVTSKL